MQLVLLGTTGYHPNERRHTACLMLPELGVVLDAGSGMFRVRERLQGDTLDIFLTHAHLDHIMGLTFLFDIVHERPDLKVVVHAQAEKLAAIRDHLLSQAIFPVDLPCEYRELASETTLADGGRLSHFPLIHPGGSVGFRIDWPDRSLAYVTDTTADPAADYVEKIRGVDVLVHECYFPDGYEAKAELTGHSTLSPVLAVAQRAEAKRVVLVHVNPLSTEDDPLGLAPHNLPTVEIGEDNQVIEF